MSISRTSSIKRVAAVIVAVAVAVGIAPTLSGMLGNSHGAEDTSSKAVRGEGATSAELAERLTRLNEKLSTLNAELSALKRAPNDGVRSASREPKSAGALEDASSRGGDHQGDNEEDTRAAFIEQSASTEPLDPAWALSAENSIKARFQDPAMQGLKLVDARCHSTICRIEVGPSDSEHEPGDFDQSLRKLLVRGPWQGQAFGRVDDPFGPSPHGVVFLAREGKAIPLPEPAQ